MTRFRIVSAICLLFAIAAMVPTAHAQVATAKAIIAGSSALWQSMALAAYNWKSSETFVGGGGACIAGFTAPCFHYTNKASGTPSSCCFQVTDSRPTYFTGGTAKSDINSIWIIWDSHTTTAGASPNVLAFIKVDSVVGDRCYFGQPQCTVNLNANGDVFPPASNAISVWPDGSSDTPVASIPGNVQVLFTSGSLKVSAAATDIRGEDGAFAICRANSALDTANPNAPRGLGYNTSNTAGVCPQTNTLATLVGTDITDSNGFTAHPLAFNVTGKDPFSGIAIPAATTVPAGAAPVVFITHSLGSGSALDGVYNVSDAQLQSLLNSGGGGCVGGTLGGNSGNVDVWLREPTSGTYNTIEYNAFAYNDFSGTSQEAGVTSSDNPLNQPCQAGGGNEKRGIGTSEVINKGVVTDTTNDSIAYTFFSYGNVAPAADTACGGNNCHYLTLNNIDPIFHVYYNGSNTGPFDPGQPHTFYGQVPSVNPDSCGTGNNYCPENNIWTGHLSFPNLRSGQYSAWSILRLISNGTPLATVKSLVAASQDYVVSTLPDFVPVTSVTTPAPGDPGLQLLRSHFQQVDNAGNKIGGAPDDTSVTGDVGGDVAGCIEHATAGTTGYKTGDQVVSLIHTAPGTACSVFPTSH